MHSEKQFDFNNLIILEMANNHQGSVAHGKKIITSLAPVVEDAGVRAAIKFQLRDLDTFIHPHFRHSAEYKHIPRFISTALSHADFKKLVRAAEQEGFLSMATPSDEASVDTIEDLGIEIIKVASCSAADWPLLECIAEAGKPVVCSTGGLSIEQVDNLVSFLEHRGVHFALMHCVSIYPTPSHKLGLERIRIFKDRYPQVTIGYSTHEDPDNIDAVRIAYANGARIFERHVGVETKDIKLNAYSSRPEQIERWLEAYNSAVSMIGSHSAALEPDDEDELEQLTLQMRGIYVRKKIKRGTKIKRGGVFFAMPLQKGQIPSGKWRPDLIADRDYKAREPLPEKLAPTVPTRKQIIYRAVHDIKGMLNSAHIFVNDESSVTLAHPYGIEKFFTDGWCVIECVQNQPYRKNIIILLQGQRHPAHYQKNGEKTLQVLSGICTIDVKGRRKILYPGDVITIPPGTWHAILESDGAIIEELTPAVVGDNVYFMDKKINKQKEEERITRLIHWGRHQFDTEGRPTYHD